MAFTEQREEIIFAVFGKEKVKPGQEKSSYIVEPNQTVEGLVVNITDSPMYKKVYKLQVKGVVDSKGAPCPLVVTGKTALNDAMGYGSKQVPPVKEGDLIRLTYLGMHKTGKGKEAYKFKLEVDR